MNQRLEAVLAISVELGTEKEQLLKAEAERRGVEVSDYVRQLIENQLPTIVAAGAPSNDSSPAPRTMADWLAGHIGGIRSGRTEERLSENTGEKFADYLVKKRREGRL